MGEPERPTDVRLVHLDGSTTPLELDYVGLDDQGIHVWQAVTPVLATDRVEVTTMPGRTAIRLGQQLPPPGSPWGAPAVAADGTDD